MTIYQHFAHLLLTVLAVTLTLPANAQVADRGRLPRLIRDTAPLAPVKDTDIVERLQPAIETYFDTPSTKTSTKHKLTRGFEDIAVFGYDPTLLWPGSTLQGKSLAQGSLLGISLPRAPGVLTVSNLQFREPARYSANVDRPSQGSVEAALRRLIQQPLAGPQAARVSYDRTDVFSVDQALLSVGLNAQWLSGNVKSSLESETSRRSSRVAIRFTQAYFDVSFERPSSPAAVFASSASYAEARRQIDKGNPPTYISTVTYGRILMVFVSADESLNKLRAAIEAAQSLGFASLDAKLKQEHLNTLKKSSVTVLALGGASGAVVDVLSGDGLSGLQSYLSSGKDFSLASPAYPIAFTVKHLRDDTIAKLGFTTNYIETQYSELPSIRAILIHFHTHGDNKDEDESVQMWIYRGRNELATGRWGQGEEWAKHTDKDFELTLRPAVLLSDCNKLRFRLRKHPDSDTGSGWRMSMQLRGRLVSGQEKPLVEWPEKLVGDGNQYDFQDQPFGCN
jgi:hypothetical protein